MEKLNVGDKFRSNCSQWRKHWYTVVRVVTSKTEANRLSGCNFADCECYYEMKKGDNKKTKWMGHGCEIQEEIVEIVRNTIINDYAIY